MIDASLALAPDERGTLIARVKLISWLSLVWMTAEGVIGTTAGIMANSIALIGYGVDSTITGIASVIIIWRFSGDRVDSDHAEARAQKIVAITFFLLAPYIIITAIHHLVTGSKAQASWVGIGLAVISITLMPLFGRAKKRIGNRLQSPATEGEGTQNILCAYLARHPRRTRRQRHPRTLLGRPTRRAHRRHRRAPDRRPHLARASLH